MGDQGIGETTEGAGLRLAGPALTLISPRHSRMHKDDSPVFPSEGLVRVLHLEDNPYDAELADRALAASGLSCSITRVSTEHELEVALVEGSFDLVLSDHRLRGFDGKEALVFVRKAFPDLPFILLSGSIRDETAAEMLSLGANDCISKDDPTLLGPAVRRALSSGS